MLVEENAVRMISPSALIPPVYRVVPKPGLRLAQLEVGRVYVDRLSFIRVLVLLHEATRPSLLDRRKEVRTTQLYGWYYSSVWGVHKRMELHEHQLMLAP